MAEPAPYVQLTKEQIKHIHDLAQLDIDAVYAYSEAISKEEMPDIKDKLTEFMRDHERHANELSKIIRANGEKPPEYTQDFKGHLIEGFTRVRSAIGSNGALKAMRTNEKITNATYERALEYSMPEALRELILQNRDDERRHLEFIEAQLAINGLL